MLNKDELSAPESKGRGFRIVEFEPKYQDQIISVIGKGLMELKVIPESDEPLQDEDLYQIPEVYKNRGEFWVALKGDKVIGTVARDHLGFSPNLLNNIISKSHFSPPPCLLLPLFRLDKLNFKIYNEIVIENKSKVNAFK